MFVVKGKSKGPGKRNVYVFDLWWKMSCEVGVEATSRKEAEAILAEVGGKGRLDLSETNTDGYQSGTTYLGMDRN